MKARWKLALVLAAAGSLLLQAHGMAGEKDKKEKDKEQVKKKTEAPPPIVVNDELSNVDLKDKVVTQAFCKTFTFKMEKGKAYQIELTSTAFRPYLRLENSAGVQVGTDFDRFGNQSAFISHNSAKTEDYQIIATTLNGGGVGKFTLTVKQLTGEEGKPITLKIEKGEASYAGNLTKADPRYSGKIHKLFVVKLEEGKTYQIDHKSRNMDAYLYLIGPDGNVLSQNDDSNGTLDSQIVHRVGKTGEYRIVATSLGGQGVGQFAFSVRHTGGPREEKKDAK